MQSPLDSDLYFLLRKFGGFNLKRTFYTAALIGLCNASLIVLINEAATEIADQKTPTIIYLLFFPVLLCQILLLRLSNRENVTGTQTLVHRLRMHVLGKVLRNDLLTLEALGIGQIMRTLNRDSLVISQAMLALVPVLQSTAVFVFAILYLFFLSLTAGLIVSAVGLLIVAYFSKNARERFVTLDNAWVEEGLVSEKMAEFLSGFKEIKMNSARARDLSLELLHKSRDVSNVKANALIDLTNNYAAVQVLVYILVGATITLVPILSDTFYLEVMSVTTTSLFVVGSLTGMVQALPLLSESKIASQDVRRFLAKLEGLSGSEARASKKWHNEDIKSIAFENLSFKFKNNTEDHPFAVGPINYKFEPGLAYFVRGDNGSGKTTVMRLLTGLIAPDSGKILVDGRIVSPNDSQSYRNLFSCIFSDFHLFGRLYGLSSVDDERVKFWLDKLGIADKVSVVDGKFDNLTLSTGQRKRIALMVAVLEERPIVVLDEWASDQDPPFRKFFYETIIPELKALNKIVIAITHDENYFSYADHLLRIDSGQLTEDFQS